MRKEVSALILVSFFLFSRSVFAQTLEFGDWYSVEYIWEEVFGLPAEWIIPRNFIFNFLVPFLALFAVCLGMIRALGMFRRTPNIEIVLAFSMAFMTLPSKLFIKFVAGSLAFMGGFAYLAFLSMFVVGGVAYTVSSWLRSKSRVDVIKAQIEATKMYYQSLKKLRTDLNRIDRRLADIKKMLANVYLPPTEREALVKEEMQLRVERDKILQQMREIKESWELS